MVALIALGLGVTMSNGTNRYFSQNAFRFGSYVLENPTDGNSAPFEGSDL